MDDPKGSGEWRPAEHFGEYVTLIVRIRRDDADRLSGVVERVRTGAKLHFHGLDGLSAAIASLLSTADEGG